jgi:hypothetical protein
MASWIQYYTGKVVAIRRSGLKYGSTNPRECLKYWGSRCPQLEGADLVVSFPKLVRERRDPNVGQ